MTDSELLVLLRKTLVEMGWICPETDEEMKLLGSLDFPFDNTCKIDTVKLNTSSKGKSSPCQIQPKDKKSF